MAAFNENNLNDSNENLRNTSQGDYSRAGRSGDLVRGAQENDNPFMQADNPAGSINQSLRSESDSNREAYEENSRAWNSGSVSNSAQPGPGDEDDDDLDDDDLLDEDDDTLIPIEGDDDDDSILGVDDDDDIIPGTDMDDGDDLLDDDDDFDVNDSGVNRSTTGDIGTNISGRDGGRSTGGMIDHEPGTGGI